MSTQGRRPWQMVRERLAGVPVPAVLAFHLHSRELHGEQPCLLRRGEHDVPCACGDDLRRRRAAEVTLLAPRHTAGGVAQGQALLRLPRVAAPVAPQEDLQVAADHADEAHVVGIVAVDEAEAQSVAARAAAEAVRDTGEHELAGGGVAHVQGEHGVGAVGVVVPEEDPAGGAAGEVQRGAAEMDTVVDGAPPGEPAVPVLAVMAPVVALEVVDPGGGDAPGGAVDALVEDAPEGEVRQVRAAVPVPEEHGEAVAVLLVRDGRDHHVAALQRVADDELGEAAAPRLGEEEEAALAVDELPLPGGPRGRRAAAGEEVEREAAGVDGGGGDVHDLAATRPRRRRVAQVDGLVVAGVEEGREAQGARVVATGDDAAPPPARRGGADDADRRGEADEDVLQEDVGDVVQRRRRSRHGQAAAAGLLVPPPRIHRGIQLISPNYFPQIEYSYRYTR